MMVTLRSTHGMAIAGYMRWWVLDDDTQDFERRHQRGFLEAHHLLNLDKDAAGQGKVLTNGHPRSVDGNGAVKG